jgi:hypothetical protein
MKKKFFLYKVPLKTPNFFLIEFELVFLRIKDRVHECR